MGLIHSIACQDANPIKKQPKFPNLFYDAYGNQLKPHQTYIALCYGYLGTNYHGSSLHDQDKTVTLELQEALVNLGVISPNRTKGALKWSESSRTDTGVHAAKQVATFRLVLPEGVKVKDLPRLIQEQLSKNSPIRVWAAVKPGIIFNAQQSASSRRYHYLLPVNTFSSENIDHLNYLRAKICPIFVGRHQYANYTRHITDELLHTSIKTISEFTFTDPFDVNGTKYVLFTISGNSFMLNQIRKMIAAVLAVSHHLMTEDDLKDTLTETRWLLPRLIGTGLFLDQVFFEQNQIIRQYKDKPIPKKKDIHFSFVSEEIEVWKRNILFNHIDQIVKEKDPFKEWVNNILLQFPPNKFNIDDQKQEFSS